MIAHDVRRLVLCPHCKELGDVRLLIHTEGAAVHDYCALQRLGVAGLKALPKSEQGKLTIGGIGARAMYEIIHGKRAPVRWFAN